MCYSREENNGMVSSLTDRRLLNEYIIEATQTFFILHDEDCLENCRLNIMCCISNAIYNPKIICDNTPCGVRKVVWLESFRVRKAFDVQE